VGPTRFCFRPRSAPPQLKLIPYPPLPGGPEIVPRHFYSPWQSPPRAVPSPLKPQDKLSGHPPEAWRTGPRELSICRFALQQRAEARSTPLIKALGLNGESRGGFHLIALTGLNFEFFVTEPPISRSFPVRLFGRGAGDPFCARALDRDV